MDHQSSICCWGNCRRQTAVVYRLATVATVATVFRYRTRDGNPHSLRLIC